MPDLRWMPSRVVYSMKRPLLAGMPLEFSRRICSSTLATRATFSSFAILHARVLHAKVLPVSALDSSQPTSSTDSAMIRALASSPPPALIHSSCSYEQLDQLAATLHVGQSARALVPADVAREWLESQPDEAGRDSSALTTTQAITLHASSLLDAARQVQASAAAEARRTDTIPVLPGESHAHDATGVTAAALTSRQAAVLAAARSGDLAQLEAAVLGLATRDVAGCVDARHGASALHMWATASPPEHHVESGIAALIGSGMDVNVRAGNGATALHWAAGAGEAHVVAHLLLQGARLDIPSYTWRRQLFGKGSGQLPLHWAAESGHPDTVQLLVQAATTGVTAAARAFLGLSPEDGSDGNGQSEESAWELLGAVDERGLTALDAAAGAGNQDVFIGTAASEQYVLIQLQCTGTRSQPVPRA